ncbi:unnamed protein product [Cuscuta campestris]|uniref:Uncharacterized protein n=1 Tax=Cuscuta campestris TaxID=132261 RepID=A0A484LJN7_9ASTE|nr:unnamed protein product [Cuscuta campestris]
MRRGALHQQAQQYWLGLFLSCLILLLISNNNNIPFASSAQPAVLLDPSDKPWNIAHEVPHGPNNPQPPHVAPKTGKESAAASSPPSP